MENTRMELVILLTSTITPNSYTSLTIKDPLIRRQQYLETINFYLLNTKFKIVFVENSNDKLQNFPLVPERIEYLTFYSEPLKPDLGKGYKELEIINYAIENSVFFKKANSIVKITGRLKVLNLDKLSRNFLKVAKKKNNLIYADPFAFKNMDSRCFFFTLDFWPFLKNVGRSINVQYNFELTLWDAIKEYNRIEGNDFVPLKYPLRIEGVSGSFGVNYKHSIYIHLVRYLRHLIMGIFRRRSIME